MNGSLPVGPLPIGSVRLVGVSKRFRRHTLTKKSYTTVKSTLLTRFFKRRFPKENFIQALSDVSVDIQPGKSLGVIGRNGSGKSTLLKLITGIYRPDQGSIQVSGRISALIELGAGFHPDFTGRENIYLGGVMYGLSRKRIDELFDQIVRYAELEEFIDDPVRTYSSGMYMRLGFSLAIHTEPDILLVDEVLAVGDAAFVHRCQETISDFKRRGKTLIFVTHDLSSVERWCDEVLWLDSGVVKKRGEGCVVIDSYLQEVEQKEARLLAQDNAERVGAEGMRWGNKDVEILSVELRGADGQAGWLYHQDDAVTVEVRYRLKQAVKDLVFGVAILRVDGLTVHGTNTDIDNISVSQEGGEGVFRYAMSRLGLIEGSYYLDVAAHKADGAPYDYHHRLHKFSVRGASRVQGVYCPEHTWEFAQV